MSLHPVVEGTYREIEAELGFGMVPNVFRAMAVKPHFLAANWKLFKSVVLEGRLPRVLKEMVGIVVSCVHDSPYARDVHLHSLTVQGVDRDVLAVLSRGERPASGLAPAQQAVLELAYAAATKPGAIPAAAFAAVRDAGLDDEEVFEVLTAVQLFTAVNMFTDTAAVKLDAL